MCGLAGFVDLNGQLKEPVNKLQRMVNTLAHRGPDDEGIWFDTEVGVGLGHRRLSILDLSPEGHQPMVSQSGRYVIVYNGEVYNFAALRAELDKLRYSFRGRSDTEVMLAVIEAWGLERAVNRFVGMFAFALWDRKSRQLHLVRDRLGIKPLYYGCVNGAFVFGSELKALRAYPGFAQPINRGALALLLRHQYIPAPHSIYEGVQKLLPGHILTLPLSRRVCENYKTLAYWSAKEIAEQGSAAPFTGTAEEATQQLDNLLREAVGLRMVADVPLGAFLSGGIDSSTVVALMQAQSTRPVKTFSIGFNEAGYNEAEHAKAVASHLGTEHTELYVTAEEAMAVIPRLPRLYDEPFPDSSQIPTFLVSQLARKHVTVSLSGDGGDELFHGYDRYFKARRMWQKIGWMPRGARAAIARSLKAVSPEVWAEALGVLIPLLPDKFRTPFPGNKVHSLADVLSMDRPDALYRREMSQWRNPAAVVLGAEEPMTALTDPTREARLPDFAQRMLFLDLISYLPDDILTKVDRASMGVSLEARVPMLDHRVVEFALRVPLSMKVRGGQGKWVLRQVLYKYVPKVLIQRPKKGFSVPMDVWLRGPLRDWAEALLDECRLRTEGYFTPAPIREKWREHIEGKFSWHRHLWDVLMFQAWLEAQTQNGE